MTTIETRWSQQRSRRAFAIGAAIGIAACSGPMAGKDSLPDLDDGSVRGELVDFVARFDDGTAVTTYFLRVNGDERDQRELVLERAPDLAPMAKVKVWGVERDRRIVVNRIEPADPNDNLDRGTWQQPLINPTPLAPTKLAMAVVDVGGGTNITPDELNKRLFTNVDSTKAYYLQNSFGMHDLVGMVSPKTYTYPMTTCDTSGMASSLRATIDADVGQVSEVYLWYFGSKVSACAWSGLSGGKDTFYNASSSCVVLVQEPGHSFGMSHSSSMACTDPASGAVVPIRDDLGAGDAATCTHNEYGNRYDTMGGGCRHFNAYNKVYRTYFQKCNGVNVRTSGTFNLMPIEKPCNGIQTLQVPMPRARGFFRTGGGGSDGVTQLAYYTVELRAPIGFDSTLKPSVIINASPKWSVISTTGGRGSRGEHTWLLDMAPTVTAGTDGPAHALAAGQTFTDPGGGVAITTMSVGPEGAVIKVDITSPTTVPDAGTATVCLDGTPIDAPGPTNCGDDHGYGHRRSHRYRRSHGHRHGRRRYRGRNGNRRRLGHHRWQADARDAVGMRLPHSAGGRGQSNLGELCALRFGACRSDSAAGTQVGCLAARYPERRPDCRADAGVGSTRISIPSVATSHPAAITARRSGELSTRIGLVLLMWV